jgi:hypothetical protein
MNLATLLNNNSYTGALIEKLSKKNYSSWKEILQCHITCLSQTTCTTCVISSHTLITKTTCTLN